jgi:hypothetical protein
VFYAIKSELIVFIFRSLGLAIPPRIRFLERLQKQQGQQTPKAEFLSKHSDSRSLHNLSEVNPLELNTNSSASSDEQTEEEQDTTLKQLPFSLGNRENLFAPICRELHHRFNMQGF